MKRNQSREKRPGGSGGCRGADTQVELFCEDRLCLAGGQACRVLSVIPVDTVPPDGHACYRQPPSQLSEIHGQHGWAPVLQGSRGHVPCELEGRVTEATMKKTIIRLFEKKNDKVGEP